MSIVSRFNINWVNGMKTSADHFQNMHFWIKEQQRLVAGLNINEFNYGLLKSDAGINDNLDFLVTNESIKLLRCYAVSKRGHLITHDSVMMSEIEFRYFEDIDKYEERQLYYAVVRVDNNSYHAFGQPDPQESPIRMPFVKDALTLDIIPVNQWNEDFMSFDNVIIAQLKFESGQFEVQEDYVPPCHTINANYILLNNYHHNLEKLELWMEKGLSLVEKINAKPQRNDLEIQIVNIVNIILDYLSQRISEYKWLMRNNLSPLHYIEFYMRLANKLHFAFRQHDRKEKLYQYFAAWINIQPGRIEKTLKSCASMEYEHHQIGRSLSHIKDMAGLLDQLMTSLPKQKIIENKVEEKQTIFNEVF